MYEALLPHLLLLYLLTHVYSLYEQLFNRLSFTLVWAGRYYLLDY